MFELRLALAADKKYLNYIDTSTLEFLKIIADDEAKRFHFALHEVIINSIQACERLGPFEDTTIYIELKLDDDQLIGQVRDPFGGGGDKEDYLEKSVKVNALSIENNRGILFIDHLVDDFKWMTYADGLFEVVIKKHVNRGGVRR